MMKYGWNIGSIVGIVLLFIGTNIFSLVASNETSQTDTLTQVNNADNFWIADDTPAESAIFQHDVPFIQNTKVTSNEIFKTHQMKNNQDSFMTAGFSVKKTVDAGYIVCGYTVESGCTGGVLIKTNTLGYESWNKTYFIKLDTAFFSVEQTFDSGFIVTGTTYDSWNNTNVVLLCKIDAQGNKIWDKTYDILSDSTIGYTVKQTTDGGYIICGMLNNDENDTSRVLLIKTESNGTLLWYRTLGINYSVLLNSIQQTMDGGFIVGGTIGNSWGDAQSAFLYKCDAEGNEQWEKIFHVMDKTIGYSVIQVRDGGFALVGSARDSSYQDYLMVIKTDEHGMQLWNKTYLDSSMGFSIKQTSDNGFIIGGAYNQDETSALLLKTNSYGSELWYHTYSGLKQAECLDVLETNDKGYVFTGITITTGDSFYLYHMLLLKTDTTGNEQWCRYFQIPVGITPGYVKFYGWDVDNSTYQLTIQVGHSTFYYKSGYPIVYYDTSYHSTFPGTYIYRITWFGKEGNCSITGYVNISAGEYTDILQNLTFCDDLPQITILKPKNGLYINNKRIFPTFIPRVIGSIDIEVEASDYSSSVNAVYFYIDNELVSLDDSEPYSMPWNNRTFGRHTLKAVVHDQVGYSQSDEISVWKFF